MYIYLLFAMFMAIVFVFSWGLKGTLFEVSLSRKNLGGIIIGKELFIFVILGTFLFEIFGRNAFVTFHMTDASMHEASFYILYAIFLLLISISFFSKVVFRRYLLAGDNNFQSSETYNNEILLLRISVLLLLTLTIIMQLSGIKHAFLESILFGRDLTTTRLENTYSTALPSVVESYYKFLTVFTCVVTGLLFSRLSRFSRVFNAFLILYASSMHGDKSPIVGSIILFILAYYSQRNRLRIGKIVWLALIGLPIVLIGLFYVVKEQFPDLDVASYTTFILNRLGVGQIQGVYEQFGLQLRDPAYILNTIPFANFFGEPHLYNKDLMMLTWGNNLNANETGVMNSLFIGEALAIGGYPLMLLSPIIVAFNYCLIAVTFLIVFRHYFGIPFFRAKAFVQLLVPGLVAFTGDIDGLLMFKLNVMFLIFTSSIIFLFSILRLQGRRRRPRGVAAI